MNKLHRFFADYGLVRDTSDNLLGGVCSGIARQLRTDPWAIRAVFLLSLVVIPGSQVLIYPVLWILMPDEARAQAVGSTWQPPLPRSVAPSPTQQNPQSPAPQTGDPTVLTKSV